MKRRLLLPLALLPLLIQACDKPEEKPAVKVTPPPENTARKDTPPATPPAEDPAVATPAPAPAPPAPVPAPTPPTQAELDAYYAEVDTFVKEATPVVEAGTPITDEVRNPLRMKMINLLKKRGPLIRGMTPEQRKDLLLRMAPLTKLNQALLTPARPSLRPAARPAATGEEPDKDAPSAPAPPSPETPAPPR